MPGILFSISLLFVFRSEAVIKPVISSVFSISVAFELGAILVTRLLICDILFLISEAFVLSVTLVTKLF